MSEKSKESALEKSLSEKPERYIEKSFPIVQLNPIAMRERNAFYPVYKMHKWYARRSASTFRAILLASALPAYDESGEPTDLMAEYFKSHVDDPRLLNEGGEPMKVLDPFMGGGTTVVEAARLGFDITGSDYNPIPWFIVRTQTTPIDLAELNAAYERLADRVKDELLDLYKTECPVTGKDADIIYGFWVKQGICVDPNCKGVTDLFKNYEVAKKTMTAQYFPDVQCPSCQTIFDWELENASITAGAPQIQGETAAGKDTKSGWRPNGQKYAFGLQNQGVDCPKCEQNYNESDFQKEPQKRSKRVSLHVLVDPSTGDFFEVRGKRPQTVTAPQSGHTFEINASTNRGKFVCESCGRNQEITQSAAALGRPLKFRYFGYLAHSTHVSNGTEQIKSQQCGLAFNNDKWFAPVSAADLAKIDACERKLDEIGDKLPIPDQEIYDGYNTNRLVIHQYRKWSELFGSRQRFALGLLLRAIAQEPSQDFRDAFLGTFQSVLDFHSMLCRFNPARTSMEGTTSAHDYRNPTTTAEGNLWGAKYGRGTFASYYNKYCDGIKFRDNPYILDEEKHDRRVSDVGVKNWKVRAEHASAASLPYKTAEFDIVVTDPPYAGSVQYAEMSDYFYVWLHQILKDEYSPFEPEITLKSQEIIENEQTKGPDEYFSMLTDAWRECRRVLKNDGLLTFTFHHKEGNRWTALLKSLFEAGFYLIAAYPTHSEALNSIVIQATGGITYDIIHVCRKRLGEVEPIAWTHLRKKVREEARQQLDELEASGDVLPGPDVWMILLGKALKLFSQHYGKVIGHDGEPVELEEAMERLRVLVREVRGEDLPLPTMLRDADGMSQVYFLHVVGREGWSKDGLHIELRGYAHGSDDLLARGLIRQDPEANERYEPTPVLERFVELGDKLSTDRRAPLVDKCHALLGHAQAGEDIEPIMDEWRGMWELVREGVAYIGKADDEVSDLVEMVLRMIDTLGPEDLAKKGAQQDLL